MSATTILNLASAVRTTNGESSSFDVSDYVELAIDTDVTAGSGGTLTLFYDRLGADDATYFPIWQSDPITGATDVSTSIGAGLAYSQSFAGTGKLRWTISAGSFTFSASIIGK